MDKDNLIKNKAIRKAIKNKNKKCAMCGFSEFTVIHHIQSKESGGKDNKENLIALCPNCHFRVHNYNIPPPSFLMEKKLKIDASVNKAAKSYIRYAQIKNLKNSPKETEFNHTMVGNAAEKTIEPSLYNPHNYRLYFFFNKQSFKPEIGTIKAWLGKLKNYGSEFTALGEGVRITIKKSQAEVINKLSDQEWFLVQRSKAKEEITEILTKIDEKCVAALKKFIEVYGGSSDFKILKREGRPNLILNTKSDNKVMNEPYIDALPPKMTFDTAIVKKVYKESNVEFKEPIHAARYLENSALHEFAPEIVAALGLVAFSMPGERLRYITENIKTFDDIMRLKSYILSLSPEDKDKLSDTIFERFKDVV